MPTMPGAELDDLRTLARELATKADALAPKPTLELAEIRHLENARCSNLIEGVDDAEVLAAHVEVERLVDARITQAKRAGHDFDPMAPEFFCWLHGEFYRRVPEKFRRLEDGSSLPLQIAPGEIRERMVAVGNHWCPEPAALPELLGHFHDRYLLDQFHNIEDKLIAVVASHSRFELIHPFLDGNGRTGRLALHAALSWVLPRSAWWPVSAGFKGEDYLAAIRHSHFGRAHDMDGRGPLSERELRAWVRYVLASSLEEIGRRVDPHFDRSLSAGLRVMERHSDAFKELKDK